jgi:hypothetical protein
MFHDYPSKGDFVVVTPHLRTQPKSRDSTPTVYIRTESSRDETVASVIDSLLEDANHRGWRKAVGAKLLRSGCMEHVKLPYSELQAQCQG